MARQASVDMFFVQVLDIDESTSVYTYECASTSICINPPGGYNCSYPERQFRDGLSHGIGCIAFYTGHTKTPTEIIVGAVVG